MKNILIIISYLGLALTIVPAILVLQGIITLQKNFLMMTIGMILWFGTAPFWMKSKSLDEPE